MIYKREELGDNVGFTSVIDEKFKSRSIAVYFLTELSKKNEEANDLAASMISTSNIRYKTFAALSEKLSELYGAGLASVSRKKGDTQILGLRASWLDNKYAIDGEDIGGEMRDLIHSCLFEPNVCGGAFDNDSFAIAKKDLLDRIDGELNQKRSYAIFQASRLAFKGEPAECAGFGSHDAAAAVTPSDAFRAYQELLRTAQIEIYYVSPQKDDSFAEMFRESFGNIKREPKDLIFRSHSPLKPEPVTVTEELDVNQSKMVMFFKTDSDDKYALKMLSIILGEMPFSKLFLNVREKLSLCYYCSSTSVSVKGAFMIDSGVERGNIDKAEAEITAQLDEVKNGNISDEEIECSLMALDNAVLQITDSPSGYISWLFGCFIDGKFISPEEHFMEFRSVTKERIIEAAKSLKLDCVYLMLNKEVQE